MLDKLMEFFNKIPKKVTLSISLIFLTLSFIFSYNGLTRLITYFNSSKEKRHQCMAKLLDCAPINWKTYIQLAILTFIIFITLIFFYKKSLNNKE